MFKKYFNYQSPNKIYNALSDLKSTDKHNTLVNLIKSGFIDLKKDIGNASKDDDIIEEMYKIPDIVELILNFNEQSQEGKGLKILTPNQMLSRLVDYQLL